MARTKGRLFKLTRNRIRILYWGSVALLMIFIACPMFFFFYLFDEEQVKQMLIDQFDSNNYHVEVRGKIIPKMWHGLSLEFNDLEISTNKDVTLFHVKTANCQLSWLDLVFAHYKIKRMALNDVDIYEKNIWEYGLDNLLNWSHMDKSSFNKLSNLSIFDVNSVDESAPYPIHDGLLTIDQSRNGAVYKLGFELAGRNTFVSSEGKINTISNDIVKFSSFSTNVYNSKMKINLTADTSYHILEKQLILDNMSGKVAFRNYNGKISSSKTLLSVSGATLDNINMDINFENAFAHQGVNLRINRFEFPRYKEYRVDKVQLKYLMGIQQKKVMLDSNLSQVKINNVGIVSKNCHNELSYSSPNLINNGFKATLAGVCEYDFDDYLLNLNMKGYLNQAPLKLDLKVINSGNKPEIAVSGIMDSLDLSPFGVNKDKLLPFYYDDSPLPFGWLSLFDMSGNLSIKRFSLDRIHLNDVSTTFKLKDEVLNISKLEANVYNGTLAGNATISKLESGYYIATNETINNLDLKEMFKDLFDVEAISGKANLKIDASTNNVNSYEDLHKNLNGKILVDANHGAFQGVDFNIFSASNSLSVNKSTIFEQLRAKLNFVNGVSKDGNVTFYSPYVIANGSGVIDFVNTSLDYLLTIKSALPPNEQKISSVVIPVAAKGDLFNPQITIQNIHLFTGQPHILRENASAVKVSKKIKPVTKNQRKGKSSGIISKIKNKLHVHGKPSVKNTQQPGMVMSTSANLTTGYKAYPLQHKSGVLGVVASPRASSIIRSEPANSKPANSGTDNTNEAKKELTDDTVEEDTQTPDDQVPNKNSNPVIEEAVPTGIGVGVPGSSDNTSENQ